MKKQRIWIRSALGPALLALGLVWLPSCRSSSAGEARQSAAERQEPAATQEPAPASAIAQAEENGPEIAAEAQPPSVDAAQEIAITVHKRMGCGCCTKWVEHLEEQGFAVNAAEVPEAELQALKQRLGVPSSLRSCHTATVNGYTIEGHVPADVIRRFVAEAPQMAGLAVPGMPVGSPGMEMPGRQGEPYEVIAFDRDGNTSVYESR